MGVAEAVCVGVGELVDVLDGVTEGVCVEVWVTVTEGMAEAVPVGSGVFEAVAGGVRVGGSPRSSNVPEDFHSIPT